MDPYRFFLPSPFFHPFCPCEPQNSKVTGRNPHFAANEPSVFAVGSVPFRKEDLARNREDGDQTFVGLACASKFPRICLHVFLHQIICKDIRCAHITLRVRHALFYEMNLKLQFCKNVCTSPSFFHVPKTVAKLQRNFVEFEHKNGNNIDL